jgi:mannose-6-phosphate isomerase-like protein (cupin superfamily)
MNGYTANIEDLTTENNNFRKVLFTSTHMQLVVMSLLPGEEIGEEVHANVDQFFRIEEGEITLIIDGETTLLEEEMVAIVSAGAKHNLINNSDKPVKLYTIYTPPNHPDGTVHVTKAEADLAEAAEHHA